MPRAQRTKSAGHEALQRRASERPGVSFNGKLAGEEDERVSRESFEGV